MEQTHPPRKPPRKPSPVGTQRTLAGVALLGFTVWHIALYKSRDKRYEG